jgi:hypothetical protein
VILFTSQIDAQGAGGGALRRGVCPRGALAKSISSVHRAWTFVEIDSPAPQGAAKAP